MSSTDIIPQDFDGIDAPAYYRGGKGLAVRAQTAFGGATKREYESVDVSTECRDIFVHAFDLCFCDAEPTVETAKKWLHACSYADELVRLQMAEMPEGWRTHEQSAARHADHVVACTNWEVLANAHGKTILRGWTREDLS